MRGEEANALESAAVEAAEWRGSLVRLRVELGGRDDKFIWVAETPLGK